MVLATLGAQAASLPQPPARLMAVPGDRTVQLSWEPVRGAASYVIKRSVSATGALTVVASNIVETRFLSTNLNNNTAYHFSVTASNVAGESIEAPRLRVTPSAPVLDLLPAGAKVEKLASGFSFIEGPVWVPRDGGYLVFSDIQANRLIRWSPGTNAVTFRNPSRNANGNTLDLEGRLLTCEHQGRRIVRLETDGTLTPLVTTNNGRPFNAPNDVVVKSDGTVWFTDPNYGDGQRQPGRYVYRFHPTNGNATVTALVTNFDQPNGLCFSPDESQLYIADSGSPHHVRVFDVLPDNTLTNSRVFTVINPGVPDGMRTDAAGRLFSSAGDGVHIFDTNGVLLGKLRTPETSANVGFGGANREMIFMTANTALYGITRMPDLIVTAVQRSPPAPVAGQQVTFGVTIKNQGTAPTPAGQAIRVGFTVAGMTNAVWVDAFTDSLAPDASVNLTADAGLAGAHWRAASGPVQVRAVVDDVARIAESIENNNSLTLNFTVGEAGPDSDGDGATDTDETAAGTLPNDATSALRIVSIEAIAAEQFRLRWQSVPGRSYRVACKGQLNDLEWFDVTGDLAATEPISSWSSPLPVTGAPVFFRIRVVP